MSSSITTPQVSLADVRGQQAATKLRNTGLQNAGLKTTSAADKTAKIQKSSKEFEAALMSHWLEQAEKSFGTVPGSQDDPNADPGKEEYLGIAMQAIASSISGSHGGIGIAAMVAKHLEAQAAEKDPAKPLKLKPLHGEPIPVRNLRPGDGTR